MLFQHRFVQGVFRKTCFGGHQLHGILFAHAAVDTVLAKLHGILQGQDFLLLFSAALQDGDQIDLYWKEN